MMSQFFISFNNIGISSVELLNLLTNKLPFPVTSVERVQGAGVLASAIETLRIELLAPVTGPIVFTAEEAKTLVTHLIDDRLRIRQIELQNGELVRRLAQIRVEMRNIRSQISRVEVEAEVRDGQD